MTIKYQNVTIGDKTIKVEIEYFQMLLAEWGKTMTREEIEQFLIDSWVDDETSSLEQTKLSVDT